MKRKWAGEILTKRKHRDVRVGIVLRRKLGREPDELELSSAVGDGDDYKGVSRDEIILAYEQGHQVRAQTPPSTPLRSLARFVSCRC